MRLEDGQMPSFEDAARPLPRSSADIFEDLRALAQTAGALHHISELVYRDWAVTLDTQERKIIDESGRRWSTSKLNKNELLLLLGLMVQSEVDHTYSVLDSGDTFAHRADELLREFHDRVMSDAVGTFDPKSGKFIEQPNYVGLMAREAIYYGAESFYLHQFLRFARHRYRDDSVWLLQKIGLSIRPMIDIAKFIVDRVNAQMTALECARRNGEDIDKGHLTDSLLVPKGDVRRKYGAKADAFFAKFVTPIVSANRQFKSPFAVNAVAIAPIIEMGDHLYVPNQYRLYESLYESPFYWMVDDDDYADTAAAHRGVFLEKTAAHILESVFGPKNVHKNVKLKQGTRDVGEIDVLVAYGEFVLVVQAKSKRVTLKARAGDADALRSDFEGAIQSPYRQAVDCIDFIKSGAKCVTSEGGELEFHLLPRFFPVVVLSDAFPASAVLSRTLLTLSANAAPVIWDLGVLDCVARVLPSPIDMIFYLNSRAAVFERVHSDSEYNFLGYHLNAKLVMPPKVDYMYLEGDFAAPIDDYMMLSDVGIAAERPLGVLERLQIPAVSDLLAALRAADPRLASVVVDLYGFSQLALETLSGAILDLREEVRTTRKAIKAISIPTANGGITYAVAHRVNENSMRSAEAIGAKHKYDTKSDRWYVILEQVHSKIQAGGLLPLVWPWKEDEIEAKNSEQVAKHFNSRRDPAA